MAQGEAPARPSVPVHEQDCEFCDEKANGFVVIRRGRHKLPTGQFIFHCPRHYSQAHAAVAEKPRS